MPVPVRLAPPDADAFRRRINAPPDLDNAPSVSGPSYRVTTPYWDRSIRPHLDDEESGIEEEALYYQEGGFVRLRQGGNDVWVVIDLRQRAILDRYIRLARVELIDETPSSLGVLHATYRARQNQTSAAFRDDLIGVWAGDRGLSAAEAEQVWQALPGLSAAIFLEPQSPPDPSTTQGFYLIFTLAEGRALQYFYDGTFLTDMLGTERYDASALRPVLDPLAPRQTSEVQHEDAPGSLLWWPVMFGGGLASVLAGVIWRRRQLAGRPGP